MSRGQRKNSQPVDGTADHAINPRMVFRSLWCEFREKSGSWREPAACGGGCAANETCATAAPSCRRSTDGSSPPPPRRIARQPRSAPRQLTSVLPGWRRRYSPDEALRVKWDRGSAAARRRQRDWEASDETPTRMSLFITNMSPPSMNVRGSLKKSVSVSLGKSAVVSGIRTCGTAGFCDNFRIPCVLRDAPT